MTRKLVVPAVFLFALAYSFITAPFRGADEFNYFFRAYHVSTGRILAHRAAYGVIGGELPASLLNLATLAADFPSMPDIKLSAAQFRSANRIQLNESERVVTNFSNTALYSPLVYLPPAIGIAFGRLVSAHPLWLFYLARCLSALVVSALLGLAIRTLPPPAGSFAVFPLLPMALFQTAMITADGVTIALSLLFAAEILRVRFDPRKFNRPSRLKYLLFALLLSQLRPPYPLIGLAVLAVPRECFCDKADARRFPGLFFLLLIVPCLLWSGVAASLFFQMRPGYRRILANNSRSSFRHLPFSYCPPHGIRHTRFQTSPGTFRLLWVAKLSAPLVIDYCSRGHVARLHVHRGHGRT